MALVLAIAHAVPTAASWTQDEFILGTFWDPCLSRVMTEPYPPDSVRADSIRFLRAREAHFNLLTGTQQEPWNVAFNPGGMRYALHIASKTGLRYLVADPRFHGYREIPPWDSTTHRTVVQDYVAGMDAARRAALYGYNIADEPCIDPSDLEYSCEANAERYRDWIEALGRDDPDRLVYVNLLNVRAHDERVDKVSDEAYLRSFFAAADPVRRAGVVSTDDYPFSSAYGFNEQYFENLAMMRRVAGDRPLWVYPMAAGSNHQAETTWERLLFMTMCPLAYGAKGLIYFTYENPEWDEEFVVHGSPVQDCDRLTDRYYEVQRINRYIRDVLGPMIMGAHHRGTYHSGVSRFGERVGPGELLPARTARVVRAADNPNILLGEFQDLAQPSRWYLLVVNKSLETQAVRLGLASESSQTAVAPRLSQYAGAPAFDDITPVMDPTTGQVRIEFSGEAALAGGEARLVRLSIGP